MKKDWIFLILAIAFLVFLAIAVFVTLTGSLGEREPLQYPTVIIEASIAF